MIIDLVYDILCPWCFVAKRTVDRAVATVQPADLTIRYHPFMLYPQLPRDGHIFLDFFRSKYGESLRVPMWEQIRSAAVPLGINFGFEQITVAPHSVDPHRVVRFARQHRPEVQGALIEAITSAFYEQAQVIDTPFLVEVGATHGLDRAALAAYLASEEDVDTLFAETEQWRARGVTGMPCLILDESVAMGTPPLDLMERILREGVSAVRAKAS
jgi:predicted DsbA family dithiol-disulfide isomerase